ncbi:MAG TPA: hypothetical protein VFS77_22815 [Pyrinomonadaceae bacterium]|nr:hypothetical protein [Pyrinomonadaceae bacterium]
MTHLATYNVPLALIESYPNRRLIIRATDPWTVVQTLLPHHLDNLVALQLLDISAELEVLDGWYRGLPIEMVLQNPASDTMKLYRLCRLQRSHPVRVVLPIVAGFGNAARVASFLHLPVKLEGTPPEPESMEEFSETLNFFLHNKAVSQPIDYFAGCLTAVLHKQPVTLWELQEEDPSIVRYVTDDGVETIARPPFIDLGADLETFRFELTRRILEPEVECASCDFFLNCGGYFKWPNPDYSCVDVKQIFRRVREAAYELQDDLSLYPNIPTEAAT